MSARELLEIVRRQKAAAQEQLDAMLAVECALTTPFLTMRKFLAVRRLFIAMSDEERRTGTVFTAADVDRRREKYRRRLQRILNR